MKQLYCAMKQHGLETARLVPGHEVFTSIVNTYIPAHLSVYEAVFSIFNHLAIAVPASIPSTSSALVA